MNAANLGFADGNNVGLAPGARRSGPTGCSCSTTTSRSSRASCGRCSRRPTRRPDAGALSPKILFAEPPDLIWFAGARYDPRRGYNGRQRGYRERDDGRFDEVWETDRVCGAAMLVPRAVLEEDGLFDPALFAYSEDTDWSLRVRARGHRLYVVPASRVWHKVSASSGGESSPTTLYYGTRNALAVAERHAPLGALGTWRRRARAARRPISCRRCSRADAARACAPSSPGWRDFRGGRLGQRDVS